MRVGGHAKQTEGLTGYAIDRVWNLVGVGRLTGITVFGRWAALRRRSTFACKSIEDAIVAQMIFGADVIVGLN